MERAGRGRKHSCSDCAAKFYDLGRLDAACPKCGVKLPAEKPKAPRSGQSRRSAPFRRYP
jgi:hypothetical protein